MRRARGNIMERAPGVWRLRLSAGRGDARTQTSHTVHGTRADAERELTRLLRELDTGDYLPPSSVTLEMFLARWMRDHCEPRLSPYTINGYASTIRNYILPNLGEAPLMRLHPASVQRWLAELLRGDLSTTTVRQAYLVLHKALNDACRWGVLSRNPMQHIPAPPAAHVEMQVFDHDEISRYLKASEGRPDHIAMALAVYTGARVGEICALQWSDIDLEKREITFRHNMVVLRGGLVMLKATKSGETKTIPIIGPLFDILLAQRERQARWKMLCRYYDRRGWVVSWEDGHCMKPAALSHAHQRFIRAAGVKRIRLHDLRHTCATLLIEAGVELLVVSRWLGHKNIGTTARVYAHVTKRLYDDAARKLEERLRG